MKEKDIIKYNIITIMYSFGEDIWLGYAHLNDKLMELKILLKNKELRKLMKELITEKEVVKGTLYNDDGKFCGSGYFLSNKRFEVFEEIELINKNKFRFKHLDNNIDK